MKQAESTSGGANASSPARKMSPLKLLLFPVFAMVLGLVGAFLIAEFAFRIFQIKPPRFSSPRWLVSDGQSFRPTDIWGEGRIRRPSRFAELGTTMGEYVPGAVFKIAFASNPRGYFEPDNGVRMSVNSLGLRGEEIRPEKSPGTYRILALGDSITFGVGVYDDDTFVRQLQARLNSNAPEGRRFEALNAGVQGYNTRDESACLEFRWLNLKPDLVLVFFYINDAYDDTAILNMGQELDIHSNKPAGPARYSYVYDMVQHKYQSFQKSKAMEAYYRQQYFSDARRFLDKPEKIRVDWKTSRAALGRMVQVCRERNVKIGLVMFPELYNLKRGYPFTDIHALVREACAEEKIPFLDLLDTFRGRDEPELWVHPTDHHPNETAHFMAGGAIEKFVRASFLEKAPTNSSAKPAR